MFEMVTRRNSYTLVLHSHLFIFAINLKIPRIIKQLIIVKFVYCSVSHGKYTDVYCGVSDDFILGIDFVMVCIVFKDCETHPSSLCVGL